MITRDQKIVLIKTVNRYALSDMRVKAFKEYSSKYQVNFQDIPEISDFIMLREETIKNALLFE